MENKKTAKFTNLKLKNLFLSYNSIVIFLLLLILGTFFVGKFQKNYSTIVVEASLYGFIAIGLSLVMITGNIDLSVGFQLASSAVMTVLVLDATGSLVLACLAALATGAVMGAVNGFVVTGLGISPLIATIATNYIYKGFVYYFTKDGSFYPEGELRDVLKESIAGVRFLDSNFLALTVFIFLAALILLFFVLKKTRFGIGMYIAGDNAEAGQLAGINIQRTQFWAYVLCGICCAIAGIFFASKSGAAVYTQAEGRDVFAISACVIGGVKMAGGKGTMINVLLGILIMRIISTGMNLMLLPSAWVNFVSGATLVLVLIIDRVTAVKKED